VKKKNKPQRWFVYLARCADDSLYTGCTNDLTRRFAAHNAGKGARYTRSRLPVTLAWSRRQKDKSRAMSLEARIKQLTRAETLKLIKRLPLPANAGRGQG
jgi:putative endonuclease